MPTVLTPDQLQHALALRDLTDLERRSKIVSSYE